MSAGIGERDTSVRLSVFPDVPKEGIPIIVNSELHNPMEKDIKAAYQLFANGELLSSGEALLSPGSKKILTFVYPYPPSPGERVFFQLKADFEQDRFQDQLSYPAYPPQVWSSFISFASFSTSMMGSMGSMGQSMGSAIQSMQFYNGAFVNTQGNANVGLLFSITLIGLLIFMELTEPLHQRGFRLPLLRTRFNRLTAILFIVFLGMVLTKVVMIIG